MTTQAAAALLLTAASLTIASPAAAGPNCLPYITDDGTPTIICRQPAALPTELEVAGSRNEFPEFRCPGHPDCPVAVTTSAVLPGDAFEALQRLAYRGSGRVNPKTGQPVNQA